MLNNTFYKHGLIKVNNTESISEITFFYKKYNGETKLIIYSIGIVNLENKKVKHKKIYKKIFNFNNDNVKKKVYDYINILKLSSPINNIGKKNFYINNVISYYDKNYPFDKLEGLIFTIKNFDNHVNQIQKVGKLINNISRQQPKKNNNKNNLVGIKFKSHAIIDNNNNIETLGLNRLNFIFSNNLNPKKIHLKIIIIILILIIIGVVIYFVIKYYNYNKNVNKNILL